MPTCLGRNQLALHGHIDLNVTSIGKFEFHVHKDASNLVVGAMLAHNHTKKLPIDQSITYASWLFDNIGQNYMMT
jgi:hypothetical protein